MSSKAISLEVGESRKEGLKFANQISQCRSIKGSSHSELVKIMKESSNKKYIP